MKTELDKRQELIEKIKNLSAPEDVQKVKIFIAGLEAGKAVKAANGKQKP